MNKNQAKRASLQRRKRRVRAKVFGTAERPRLSVHRTNAHIYAQVIDDQDGKTICSASTLSPEFKETGKIGSNKEAAEFASAPSRRVLPRSRLTAVASSITAASRLWQTVPVPQA